MNAYFLLLLFLYLVGQFITTRKNKTIAMVVIFSLFMGLRNPVSNGADTIGYYQLFENFKDIDWGNIFLNQRVEYGFLIYVKLCATFINNAQWFFVLSAFLMFIPFGMVVFKYSYSIILSAIMFIGFSFFAFYTTGFRQSLAISISMLAFLNIENKKRKRFILYVLLAMTFHKSAIVFLPAYWISRLKSKNLTLAWFAVVTIALIIAMPWLAKLFNNYGDYDYVVQSTSGGIPTFVCITLITILLYCGKDTFLTKKKFNLAFYNIQFVTTILWILRSFNIMAERLSLYYFVYIVITIPTLMISLKSNGNKKIANILLIIILLIFLYKLIGGISFKPQIYEFFWHQVKI